MESLLFDWLHLIVRWLHIIAGIAWIGASFYFVWLNNHLEDPAAAETRKAGIDGELFAIHGGGFYRVHRYALAPEQLPETLHWFKWEAYVTWLSGMALLSLVYWLGASAYMVDPNVAALEPWQAVAIGAAALVVGWFAYDLLQKSPLGRNNLLFGLVGFVLAAALAWGLTQLLSGRAAYIHVGAMLGTIMAGNVFFNIIPSQKDLVRAKEEGRAPDEKIAKAAKNRSLHNNYITLPVLFIMISNHYPFTFGHVHSWAVLAAISIIGALVRHWFNLRGQGRLNRWIWPAASVGMIALALVSAPRGTFESAPKVESRRVDFYEVQAIVQNRCISCHSANPTDEMFQAPPLGVKYDTPAEIKAMAEKIKTRVVVAKTMPLANRTGMTDEERRTIGLWIDQGASIEAASE